MTRGDAKVNESNSASVIRAKRIFDFLNSRGARMSCPFCGHEQWHGWDERVALEHVIGSDAVDRRTEAFPLTCANCGFIRFQSTQVLDDPRLCPEVPLAVRGNGRRQAR